MSDTVTKPEQMLMWELFAAGGVKLQKDVTTLTPATRATLTRRGFVSATKHGRTLELALQDRGWRWIADTEPFPVGPDEKRVSAERRLLASLIASLKRYAASHETTLQSLFHQAQPTKAAAPGQAAPATPGTVETAIRAAFFDLAGRPARDNVRLSALRAALPGYDRAAVDAALLAMRRDGTANLMNLDNPRDIAAEAEAALTQGRHTFHVLWIDA